ncbi:MAG: hypothetical protein AAGI15_08705, partial [Pseudomonadota bacterium]
LVHLLTEDHLIGWLLEPIRWALEIGHGGTRCYAPASEIGPGPTLRASSDYKEAGSLFLIFCH